MDSRTQEVVDRFYWATGPCCAGCDWWQHHSSLTGECTRSAPVSANERTGMLNMRNVTMDVGAGHVFTNRDHRCGEFVDTFDWSALPLMYRKQVGAPVR